MRSYYTSWMDALSGKYQLKYVKIEHIVFTGTRLNSFRSGNVQVDYLKLRLRPRSLPGLQHRNLRLLAEDAMFTYWQEGGQVDGHTLSESLLHHCDNRLIREEDEADTVSIRLDNQAVVRLWQVEGLHRHSRC